MNRILLTIRIGALALALATVTRAADAQEMDHSKMDHSTMNMPVSDTEKPAEEKPTVDDKPASGDKAVPATTTSHAGHAISTAPESSTSSTDHAAMGHGENMPGMDHAAMGHTVDTMPNDSMQSMEGMDMSHMNHAGMSMGSGVLRTPIPELTDADRSAAVPPSMTHPSGDNVIHSYSLLDRLEGWDADPGTGLAWEAQGWIGTDLDRLLWRTEGERVDGHTEAADLELLYGRSISPWWDVVGGVRQDFKPGGAQTFAAIGIQGLAPQKFEVQAMAYLGERGQTRVRFEAEYELLLSNRLILQPRLEVNASGKDDAARGVGSGLSTTEIGLRLRYEFTRKFAPYIGVVHERAFGNTAELHRAASEPLDDTRIVVGVRTWF